eukprot:601913-Amphidinium_carterae.1
MVLGWANHEGLSQSLSGRPYKAVIGNGGYLPQAFRLCRNLDVVNIYLQSYQLYNPNTTNTNYYTIIFSNINTVSELNDMRKPPDEAGNYLLK